VDPLKPTPENRSPLPPALRWLGPPLAGLFATGAALRRCAYACGLKRSRRAAVPVISVGNLTAGGTGKTPAVAYLARGLKERGRKPGIVLRGYGASAPGELNDEGRELARQFPELSIVANPDRFAGAAEAARRGADVVVMDDGFQHWALARDLDLVLLDATDPWGGGHRLPWGYLREAPGALVRAHAVLLTRADGVSPEQLAGLRREVAQLAPQALVGAARHRVSGLRALQVAHSAPELDALRGRRILAACGLARPEHFQATLKELDVEIAGVRTFADHYVYTEADLRICLSDAQTARAEAVVITEKDASKWERLPNPTGNLPVWVVKIDFEIMDGGEAFWQAVEEKVRAKT
jgi:tetraacyldisaccharide 4'-kinase